MDFVDDYVTRVQALELTSERVKEHWDNGDTRLLSIDAGNGLNVVYDLHEAYFKALGIEAIADQDDHLAENGGQVVGALACARGARTHHLVALPGTTSYGELPYGVGPYGGGPVWGRHEWTSRKFARRSGWYAQHVMWRALWQPFDEAWLWFLGRIPEDQRPAPPAR